MKHLTAFIYKNDLYIRAIPGKNLFHSTMVHEVVNRGDIFAIRVKDQCLTIIPGNAEVTHGLVAVDDSFCPPPRKANVQLSLLDEQTTPAQETQCNYCGDMKINPCSSLKGHNLSVWGCVHK